MNLVLPSLLNESASRLLYLLLGKSPLGRKPFLSGTLRVTSTGRNTLLMLRRISSVKGIGKKLLVRSLATLANRIFPGESLSPTQFLTTAVTRKGETMMTNLSQMTLRMRLVRCLGLPLPPLRRMPSSPDSPGKGESISCHSLFPKLFQSVKRKNRKNGPTRT